MVSGRRRTGARAAWALAAGLSAMSAVGVAPPAHAQDASADDSRLRKLEAEVRALQRRTPASAVLADTAAPAEPPVPTATPMTELLTRMDALETQVARLTAQNEETTNREHQLEAKLVSAPAPATVTTTATTTATAPTAALAAAPTPAPAPAPSPAPTRSATASNLAAMTGGSSDRTVAGHATGPARPSAQRVAAVKAVIKPDTGDAPLDEYSYGFRLYTAKFYPEAEQQLKLYIDKYSKDAHVSHARNLLGRAYLDDGKAADAAPWFLMNYKTDPQGARAADSLLNLAEAMRQLGDTNRACVALNEFASTYAADAQGRLHQDYTRTRGGLTCS